ncbi:hypothetical protein CYMTET_25944, partial [Cymbomonas tetramitiformis]
MGSRNIEPLDSVPKKHLPIKVDSAQNSTAESSIGRLAERLRNQQRVADQTHPTARFREMYPFNARQAVPGAMDSQVIKAEKSRRSITLLVGSGVVAFFFWWTSVAFERLETGSFQLHPSETLRLSIETGDILYNTGKLDLRQYAITKYSILKFHIDADVSNLSLEYETQKSRKVEMTAVNAFSVANSPKEWYIPCTITVKVPRGMKLPPVNIQASGKDHIEIEMLGAYDGSDGKEYLEVPSFVFNDTDHSTNLLLRASLVRQHHSYIYAYSGVVEYEDVVPGQFFSLQESRRIERLLEEAGSMSNLSTTQLADEVLKGNITTAGGGGATIQLGYLADEQFYGGGDIFMSTTSSLWVVHKSEDDMYCLAGAEVQTVQTNSSDSSQCVAGGLLANDTVASDYSDYSGSFDTPDEESETVYENRTRLRGNNAPAVLCTHIHAMYSSAGLPNDAPVSLMELTVVDGGIYITVTKPQERVRASSNRELKAPSKVMELEMGVAPSGSVLARELGSRRTMRLERSPEVQPATVLAGESDYRSLAGSESSDSGSDEERVRRILASEPRVPASRHLEAPPGFEGPSKGVLVVYGEAAKPDLKRQVKVFLSRRRQSQLAAILGEWNAAAVLAAQRRERVTLASSRREALLLTHAWSDWAENAKQFVLLRYFHAGVCQRQVGAFFSAWQRLRKSVRKRRIRWEEVQWVLDHRKERLMQSSWSTWQSHLKAPKCDKAKPRANPQEEGWWLDIRRGLRYLGQDQEVTGIMWFQHDDHGLSASGSHQLELYQQPLPETKKMLRQKSTDPFNSLERTSFKAFVVNINRPGQLVGRGVSLQDVRKAVRRDLRALCAKEECAFVVYLAPDGSFGATAFDSGGGDSSEDSPNNVVAGLASEPSSGGEARSALSDDPNGVPAESSSELASAPEPSLHPLTSDTGSDSDRFWTEFPRDTISGSDGFGAGSPGAEGSQHLERVAALAGDVRPAGFASADEEDNSSDPLSFFASKREANGAFALLPAAVRRKAIEDHAAGKPATWHAQAAAALQQRRQLVSGGRPQIRRRQIPMGADDVEKTAMTTHFGAYEWLVMPMGLSNSPSTWQRMMTQYLGHLPFCRVFVEDIMIFSADEPGEGGVPGKDAHHVHLDHLRQDKVVSLRDWPDLETVTHVRQFLGMCGFYRRYIQSFADMAYPLTRLTKSGVEWTWRKEEKAAFNRLKVAPISSPTLAQPDQRGAADGSRPFCVQTDASGVALGGVLMQDFGQGLQPIAFESRQFSSAEQNYHAGERELCAIHHCTTITWRHYLIFTSFKLMGDHKPLQWLFALPENSAGDRPVGGSHYDRVVDRQDWKLIKERFDEIVTQYGPFDVDACYDSMGVNRQVEHFWTDCLKEQWRGKHVWCNPPYTKDSDLIERILWHFLAEWRADPENTSAMFLMPDYDAPWRRLIHPKYGLHPVRVFDAKDEKGRPNHSFESPDGGRPPLRWPVILDAPKCANMEMQQGDVMHPHFGRPGGFSDASSQQLDNVRLWIDAKENYDSGAVFRLVCPDDNMPHGAEA